MTARQHVNLLWALFISPKVFGEGAPVLQDGSHFFFVKWEWLFRRLKRRLCCTVGCCRRFLCWRPGSDALHASGPQDLVKDGSCVPVHLLAAAEKLL